MTQSDVSAREPVIAGSRSPLLEIATRDLREPSPTVSTWGHWPSWLHAQVPEGLAFCLSCKRVITPWQLGVEVCIGALETAARLAATKVSLPRPEA